MKVIIQKPDLDTCLTALVLGVTERDDVVVVLGNVTAADLLDPGVLCIESGGSGRVDLNNFDHHDPTQDLPPACRQAYDSSLMTHNDNLNRLVEYVCMVDVRQQDHPTVAFPSLSNIFSGMLFCEKTPLGQFFRGIEILRKVMDESIDPFGTMPDFEEWREFRIAKEDNINKLRDICQNASYFQSQDGRMIGFSESDVIGGIGALYHGGCDVVIILNNDFGFPPVRKYTIAGNGVKVSHLLAHLDIVEEGWGGRETIIGSPRTGSGLPKDVVVDLTIKNL